ncbi:MAG: hypothetical protein CM1200mP40_34880 [Gammaproteobacteria bacterium]|nr:MAG: hypothetical protein CM1200mP40_34880 [Gammaproteobacteria bacterium]
MAWNEPGSNGNDNDPWGGGRRGGDQGPPDIDQVIKNLTKKFNGLFGGSRGGGSRLAADLHHHVAVFRWIGQWLGRCCGRDLGIHGILHRRRSRERRRTSIW